MGAGLDVLGNMVGIVIAPLHPVAQLLSIQQLSRLLAIIFSQPLKVVGYGSFAVHQVS